MASLFINKSSPEEGELNGNGALVRTINIPAYAEWLDR